MNIFVWKPALQIFRAGPRARSCIHDATTMMVVKLIVL
jgi:hypothetical protein